MLMSRFRVLATSGIVLAMATAFNKDLLDYPREDERHELKAWFDLAPRVATAEIAKDLAVIANYGGGYIIIGYEDRTLTPQQSPTTDVLSKFSQDSIGDIVRTFLEPVFQCQVSTENSSAGNAHVVVHGASPVFIKVDQHDSRRKLLFAKGALYIRKAKPESALISSPLEW